MTEHAHVESGGLETGRLPEEHDVLAQLDKHSKDGVLIAELVEVLLDRRDGYDQRQDPVRMVFTERCFDLARQLVEKGWAEWTHQPGHAHCLRRKVDPLSYADLAVSMGQDPEEALEQVTGAAPRYRNGPGIFWKIVGEDGSDDIVRLAIVSDDKGLYQTHERLLLATTSDGQRRPLAIAEAEACDRVPEHIARRLEQKGWIPFYLDMPPAWAVSDKDAFWKDWKDAFWKAAQRLGEESVAAPPPPATAQDARDLKQHALDEAINLEREECIRVCRDVERSVHTVAGCNNDGEERAAAIAVATCTTFIFQRGLAGGYDRLDQILGEEPRRTSVVRPEVVTTTEERTGE